MTYFLSFIYLLLVAWMIFRWKNLQIPGIAPAFTTGYFILKVMLGCVVGWFYQTHYADGGDTFNYLKDANVIYGYFFSAPVQFLKIMSGVDTGNVETAFYLKPLVLWYDSGFDQYYNDARTIIKLNVLIRFISFGIYPVHVIWMNVLSYLGLRWILLFFTNEGSVKNPIALLPFFLPSVLIWGSALLKEPVMIFATGWMLVALQELMKKRTLRNKLMFVLPLLFFFFVKIYMLLLLVPGVVVLLASGRGKKIGGWSVVFAYGCCLILILVLGSCIPSFDLPALLYGKQLNTLRFSVFMHANTYMHPLSYAPSIKSFLVRFPEAVWYAVKPYQHPTYSSTLLFVFETYLLLGLMVYHILRSRFQPFAGSSKKVWVFCVAIGLLALVGYTNMVYGTMIRYRMMAFLLMAIAFCTTSTELEKQTKK